MLEKIGSVVFVLMIAFLAFVGGAMVMLTGAFPHQILRDAYRAGEALAVKAEIESDPVRTNLWQPARRDDRGVTILDPERSSQGYTLYTSGDDNAARLVDMEGRVVHEWRRPYSEVWQEGAAVEAPQTDSLIYMTRAHLFPNGDLLAIYIASADTPWGYGMVKLDRDSNVLWSYLEQTHHDLDILPDGRIVTLTHEFSDRPVPGARQLGTPHIEDYVVVLSPEGEELSRISLLDSLMESRFRRFMGYLPFFSREDPLHTNDVDYIDAETARAFAFGEEGDVIVSLRDLGVIAVLSLETGEMRWATRGPWIAQHDPTILPSGEIMLYDNFGALRPGNSTRIIQFDPETMALTWSYAGTEEEPLHSPLRSSAQPLPDGNVLITESDGGRLLEITRAGDIVWEYVNPIRTGEQEEILPVVNFGTRIDPASLDPDFRRSLEPTG